MYATGELVSESVSQCFHLLLIFFFFLNNFVVILHILELFCCFYVSLYTTAVRYHMLMLFRAVRTFYAFLQASCAGF